MGFVFMRGPESDLREAPGVLGMQTFPDGGQYWRGPGIFFFVGPRFEIICVTSEEQMLQCSLQWPELSL